MRTGSSVNMASALIGKPGPTAWQQHVPPVGGRNRVLVEAEYKSCGA